VSGEVKSAAPWRSPVPLLLPIYFVLCIAVVGGIGAYAVALPLCLLGRWWRPAWQGGGEVLRASVSVLLRLQPWLRARVDIHLPPRCVTVSNHRSHLDMFLLLAHIRNIRAIAKSTLFSIPFLGLMMRVLRQIPVKRGDALSYWNAMDAALVAVNEGDPVHVFPEMARCPPGLLGTQDFHLAPFRIALQARVPVVPIAFLGTDDAWPKGFAGVFRRQVRVQSLAPVEPRDFPSAEALRGEARRRIDEFLASHR
jgi:1-acyl-sn-glycerol-3-phosphate acyltransferase